MILASKRFSSGSTDPTNQCSLGIAGLAKDEWCHSQDDDRAYHSVQATLGEDTAEESRSLLDLSVNADWDETAADPDDIDAVTDDATVVSDAEEGIVTAFTDERRNHQLDLVHVGRTLDYNLWDDGVFSLDRRNEIVSEVIDEVFHLKNSVAKHRPAEEFAAIRERIARTNKELPMIRTNLPPQKRRRVLRCSDDIHPMYPDLPQYDLPNDDRPVDGDAANMPGDRS